MTTETFFFCLLSIVALVSAILMITRRSPVVSVLYLILNFFSLAGLYLTLNAQFIAVIQVIVYAGAIMVLFLFVVMLLRLGDEARLAEPLNYRKIIAVGLAVALFLEIAYIIGFRGGEGNLSQATNAVTIGTVESIGTEMFTHYLFPFEVTSMILLAAIVGAVVLAKRHLEQKER
jgi:NADH-quinone oxidoreductase subunit J